MVTSSQGRMEVSCKEGYTALYRGPVGTQLTAFIYDLSCYCMTRGSHLLLPETNKPLRPDTSGNPPKAIQLRHSTSKDANPGINDFKVHFLAIYHYRQSFLLGPSFLL